MMMMMMKAGLNSECSFLAIYRYVGKEKTDSCLLPEYKYKLN